MSNDIQTLFNRAINEEKQSNNVACEHFSTIITLLKDRERTYEEEKIFATCNGKVFIASGFEDVQYADEAIKSYQKYLEMHPEDNDAQFEYITILELSYNYEMAFKQLTWLKSQIATHDEAASRLSSGAYMFIKKDE